MSYPPGLGFRLTLTAAAITTISLARVPESQAAPRKPLGKVTIAAGDHARQNTPATFKLPIELGGRALELRGPGGPLPLTVTAEGDAHVVIPRLAKAEVRKFDLAEARRPAAGSGVEVKAEPSGLRISIAGRPAFHYRAVGAAPRPEIGPEFVRGGYLHPVFTPAGVAVTDDYPKDHKHQHGIWTAWTSTEYEGRKPDFWNMGQKKARKDHASIGTTFSGPAAGGFAAKLNSTDLLANPAKVVIEEDWKVIAYRLPGRSPHHVFDLTWTDTVVGNSPLVLPEYRYGGLGVRGHIAWLDKAAPRFLTSEGKDRVAGDNTTARWVFMGGKVESAPVGIAVLDHPGNFRHPQPLRLHPDKPYLSVAPQKVGRHQLDPGKPYVSRYRFVVSDGEPDAGTMERFFTDWAHPPVVTVELATPSIAVPAPPPGPPTPAPTATP